MKKYLAPLFFVLISCGEHSLEEFEETLQGLFGTGLLPEENPDKIQQDIKSFSDADASSLPSSFSLEDKFPPVGHQGQYGTCVVWSIGYALKTALNAIDKNWSPFDLAKTSNQTSPKDVWITIPSYSRRSNCNGTSIEAAMNALIRNGAASMADIPYNMENSCNESPSDAKGNPNNKLANYRRIAIKYNTGMGHHGMSVDNLKSYLAQGRPILFAANIGERFYRWNISEVISSDNGNYGSHAMVLVGYDDTKGANGAFRVRNSWGTDWGDNGSIWVDYNYFVRNFCTDAYVAQNPNSPDEPPDNPPASNSYDLLASFAEDYPDPEDKTGNPRARAFSYEIYNNGTKDILASQKWGVYYMYYNAYNANEYGIIYEDYYTDEQGRPCTKPEDFENEVCWGKHENTEAIGGIWNNMNVKPGKRAGEAEAGDGYVFEMPYEMPSITGEYYLIVYADYKDAIKESNENNNMYFISDKNGKPLKFENGVMQSTPANLAASAVLGKRARPAPVHSVVDLGELNAYTPQEIKTLLNRDKHSGVLAKKIAEHRESSASPVKRARRER